MHQKIEQARYIKIALDIANRIYHGKLKSGSKIHGRSTLAGEYSVSPETIRRSVKLLEDMEVVSIIKGSGIYIKSKEKAYNFIQLFQDRQTIRVLKKEVNNLMAQKKAIESDINNKINNIIEYSERLKNTNPLNPIEIEISNGCSIVGATISESKFWQNTGGTIVAVRRGEQLIVSPGPYLKFESDDTILVVGDSQVYQRIMKYIY